MAMEEDSNLELKPDVDNFFFDHKPDVRKSYFAEKLSSLTPQNDEHSYSLLPEQEPKPLIQQPVSKYGPSAALDNVKHEVNEGDSEAEEEKPCIAALKASVATYLANQKFQERKPDIGSPRLIGMFCNGCFSC